jgi:hypothetical protein
VPLAIELAAARTRLLHPGALLDRLRVSLDALGTGAVDMPERQQTLRATVDWSVGLLGDAERSLLEVAAVFVDGWTIEAAARVAGLTEDRALGLCEALARHSLIFLDSSQTGPRSQMLETIRVFLAATVPGRPLATADPSTPLTGRQGADRDRWRLDAPYRTASALRQAGGSRIMRRRYLGAAIRAFLPGRTGTVGWCSGNPPGSAQTARGLPREGRGPRPP